MRPIGSGSLALRYLALLGICGLSIPTQAARAACAQWDASGGWGAVQSNGSSPHFVLQQADNGLQGSASYGYVHKDNCVLVACGDDYYSVDGSADGSIDRDAITVTAYWNNGTIGVYAGTINAQGRIEGTTFDRLHPDTRASWYSDRTLKCLAQQGAPPSVANSPGDGPRDHAPMALGRVTAAPSNRWASTRVVAVDAARANAVAHAVVAPTPVAEATPVHAPDDLVIGRMTYTQQGEVRREVHIGAAVAIRCTYSLNATGSIFTHVEPWQGEVAIGGSAPQTLAFQGSTERGVHEAQVQWTPEAAGQTPLSCDVNPKHADAEADPDNNRWNDTVSVQPAAPPAAP